jgi:antitoxin component YwqK of YwqJK toxin-antitoxin module
MKKIKNGKWKEFNKHAVLVAEGEYVNGLKQGTWREYYDDTGALLIEENYKNGIPHGRYRSFHPNGQLCGEGEFINGLREGYFRLYDEQGTNIRNLLFVNNIQIHDNNEPAYRIERAEGTTAS